MTARRNLPSWAIDLVRDGVPVATLKAEGDNKAVDKRLVQVAMSAQRCGWSRSDWFGLVAERGCSEIGNQAAHDGKGRAVDLHKRLDRCWNRAEQLLDNLPNPFTRDDVPRRIGIVRQWLPEAILLEDEERIVLDIACDICDENGSCTVPLPWRAVEERSKGKGTPLGPSACRRVRNRLARRNLLIMTERGRSGTKHPRAHVYALPVAHAAWQLGIPLGRNTGSTHVDGVPTHVDAVDQDHGRPPIHVDGDHGTDERIKGMSDDTRVRLTVEGATLERVLAALQQEGLVASADPPVDLPEGVVPIRPEDREAK